MYAHLAGLPPATCSSPEHTQPPPSYTDNVLARKKLRHRCDVEATLSDGLTRPLHIACSKGYEKAATLLLEHKAEISAPGPNGHRPLHLAAREGHALIVEVLTVLPVTGSLKHAEGLETRGMAKGHEVAARVPLIGASTKSDGS